MVKSKLRYFTYKITFKDLPKYFYFGKHKDTGKPYFGTPKTWKHLWDQFEPEIQILQWYETEEEVRTVENKIITATWKDKYSLNEHNGFAFSEEVCKRAGKSGGKATGSKVGKENIRQKRGIFDPEYRQSEEFIENCVKGGMTSGRDNLNQRRGIFSPEYRQSEEFINNQINSAIKGGNKAKKEMKGINNPNYRASEEYKKHMSMGGKKASSQKWMCTVTGYISSPCGLSNYQKSRDIDTSKRVGLTPEEAAFIFLWGT